MPPDSIEQLSPSVAKRLEERIGLGTYAIGAPPDAKSPVRTVYRGPNLHGPLPSSRWWSSAAWETYSHPMYPHPLSLQATDKGLDIGAPELSVGLDEQFESLSILAPFRHDLTLTVGDEPFPDTRVDGHSDFAVTFRWENVQHLLLVTAAHGSPYLFGRSASARLKGDVTVWSDRGPTLGILVNGHPYGVFAPSNATWQIEESSLNSTLAGRGYWSLALLPSATEAMLETFAAHAHAHLIDSRVTWRYDTTTRQVAATYQVELRAMEGASTTTLLALYPHQWRYLAAGQPLDEIAYPTVRGSMRVICGNAFTTKHPMPGILSHLPALGNETVELAQLVKEARDEGDHHLAHLYPHGARDPYWTGVSLGRVAALVPYAERVDDQQAVGELVSWLKATLEDHFSASSRNGEPKHAGFFWYDPVWHTVIGHPGGFGADEALNDHHYQYGYFVRAAVEIARHDPDWARPERWGGMVDLLVRDYASIETDAMFPRLRHFDVYAGHSWATGRNDFSDGANAESVSESIAASAAVLLWGETIGNLELRDLGAYLYATEVAASNEYWHDVHQENFPAAYRLSMVGQIWGGKSSYCTWWTEDPEAVRGISILPLTPASFFLGVDPDQIRRNLADLRRQRQKWSYWPDIFWCYEALADAQTALRLRNEYGQYVMGHSESHAHTLGWLLDMLTLGQIEPNITGDTITSVVFRCTKHRTYIASNLGNQPRTVRFSDGMVLDLDPRTSAMKIESLNEGRSEESDSKGRKEEE